MKSLESELKNILDKDPRYAREAYFFIYEALDYTVNSIGEKRHVAGQELLEGIRKFAVERFGLLAKGVFEEWGITTCKDFGEIVFNLVEYDLMGKTDTDSREDFNSGYDFSEAFEKDVEVDSRIHGKGR